MISNPRRQFTRCERKGRRPEQSPDRGLLGDELICFALGELIRAERLIRSEKRVGQHVVHPRCQFGMRGAVLLASCRLAPDRTVRRTHIRHGSFHLWPRAVGGLGDIERCPVEASERIAPVARVLLDPGNHLGMSSLNEQCPNPTDKGRGVADDAPRNRVRSEQTGVALIVERVLEW